MITQFIIWILPPVVYLLMVRFFRKNVKVPFIPRVAYWFTPLSLIPFFGISVIIVLSISVCIATVNRYLEFKEDSKFYKNWIER